jgi:hypothetical protein
MGLLKIWKKLLECKDRNNDEGGRVLCLYIIGFIYRKCLIWLFYHYWVYLGVI